MVTIKLDKERHLRLTLRGIKEFKNITGTDLLKGFNLSDMDFEKLSVLMWACLIHEDKELTYDAFLDIVDLSNMLSMKQAVINCINESLPDRESVDPLAETPPPG